MRAYDCVGEGGREWMIRFVVGVEVDLTTRS